jgi:hypothetical protein
VQVPKVRNSCLTIAKNFVVSRTSGALISAALYGAINDREKVTDVKKTKKEYAVIGALGAILGFKRAVPVSILLAVEKRLDILG